MRKFALLLTALASLPALAQTPQQKVAAFRQLLAENQAKRRMYTWLETTHIAYQGTIKVTKVSDCQFNGPNPKPECTELSLQQAPLPGGFFRKKIAENKEEELKAYMDSVRTLLAEYVPVMPGLVEQGYQQGNVAVAPDPEAGLTRLIISNYKLPGDKITVTYSPSMKRLMHVKIATYLGKPSGVVTADVTFAALPNGVFYAYQKVLNATAKEVVVTVTATNFAEVVQQ